MKKLFILLLIFTSLVLQAQRSDVADKPVPNKGYPFFMISTERRDKIKNPSEGMFIYNTDTKCVNFYNGTTWGELCSSCVPVTTIADAGIDQILYNDSVLILNGNVPGVGNVGQWSNLSIGAGTFSNTASYNSTFTGNLGEKYTLRWTMTSLCGTTYDDVKITINFGIPCPGLDSFLYVGKWYHTVLIGSQCWMKENLDVGVKISIDVAASNNGYIEKYCYDDDISNCDIYGGIYLWNEMMNYNPVERTQGICAIGWHIPSRVDWETLITYLSGVGEAGGKMKERGNNHWYTPNTGGKNESGFTALAGGYMNYYRESYTKGETLWLWSSTWYSAVSTYYQKLMYNSMAVSPSTTFDTYGLYVRCLKD